MAKFTHFNRNCRVQVLNWRALIVVVRKKNSNHFATLTFQISFTHAWCYSLNLFCQHGTSFFTFRFNIVFNSIQFINSMTRKFVDKFIVFIYFMFLFSFFFLMFRFFFLYGILNLMDRHIYNCTDVAEFIYKRCIHSYNMFVLFVCLLRFKIKKIYTFGVSFTSSSPLSIYNSLCTNLF